MLLIAFLRRLTKDGEQKVFLIVDNLKVHHAKRVKAWLASQAHEIELFYLPACAPDRNPDEYLNNDLKQKLRQGPRPGSKEDLVENTRTELLSSRPLDWANVSPAPDGTTTIRTGSSTLRA